MLPPSDRAAYVAGIVNLLASNTPSQIAARGLQDAWSHDGPAELLCPPAEVSLAGWLRPASGTVPTSTVKLQLVVGESRGTHRTERELARATGGQLTRAATSDGVGGAV